MQQPYSVLLSEDSLVPIQQGTRTKKSINVVSVLIEDWVNLV